MCFSSNGSEKRLASQDLGQHKACQSAVILIRKAHFCGFSREKYPMAFSIQPAVSKHLRRSGAARDSANDLEARGPVHPGCRSAKPGEFDAGRVQPLHGQQPAGSHVR